MKLADDLRNRLNQMMNASTRASAGEAGRSCKPLVRLQRLCTSQTKFIGVHRVSHNRHAIGKRFRSRQTYTTRSSLGDVTTSAESIVIRSSICDELMIEVGADVGGTARR